MWIATAAKIDDFDRAAATLLEQDIFLFCRQRRSEMWNVDEMKFPYFYDEDESESCLSSKNLPVSNHNE